MSNNEILKIENLKKTYSNTTEPVLKGIDLSIYEGDFLCVLGPSGCGKSTMIRCIAGFEDYEGTIEVSGESVKGPGTDRIQSVVSVEDSSWEHNISFKEQWHDGQKRKNKES